MLTARQMNEIVAFDWERRTSGHYDCRRYGSVTEQPRGGEPVAEHPIRKTLRYNYIVPARGGEVNVLHVAVRLDGRFVPCVKVVARWNIAKGTVEARDLEYHGIAGWIVVWAERDWRRRKFCDIIVDKTAPVARPGVVVDPKWVNYGKWKYNSGLAFPFHETVNLSALVGTKYQYCQYESGRCKTGLVDWLMLYRREPKVELLAKAGLYRLINPLGLDALRDKCVFAWVRDHAKEVEDCYSPTREIVYAARHGTTLADADRHFAVTESLKRFVAGVRRHIWNNAPDDVVRRGSGFVRKSSLMRIDYERLAAMLRKWHVDGVSRTTADSTSETKGPSILRSQTGARRSWSGSSGSRPSMRGTSACGGDANARQSGSGSAMRRSASRAWRRPASRSSQSSSGPLSGRR